MAEAGCLFSYSVSLKDTWYRSATFVDKILKGAKPAAHPIFRLSRPRQAQKLGALLLHQSDRGRFRDAVHASLKIQRLLAARDDFVVAALSQSPEQSRRPRDLHWRPI